MESNMELDDFKVAWKTLDRRLEKQNLLTRELFREGRLESARTRLRPLVWGHALQIVLGVLGALWFAPFWIAHRQETPLLLAGLAMHAYCVALIAAGVAVLAQVARIDYAAPVVAIQRALLRLRWTYVRTGLAIGLAWWFLWVPLIMVLIGMAGGDLYANAPSAVIGGLLSGVVGLFLTFVVYRWANQPSRARLGRWLADGAAGVSIRRAQAAVDDLTRFERE
jgi:hypothetical protein